MSTKTHTCSLLGIDAIPVEVEVDLEQIATRDDRALVPGEGFDAWVGLTLGLSCTKLRSS